jgi:hypothetical protein
MPPKPPALRRFVLGLLISLPLALAVWWFLARGLMIWGLEPITELLLRALWPQWGLNLVRAGTGWVVETTVPILGRPLQSATVTLAPTRFTAAFALFWALVLATPGAQRLRQLLWGTFAAMLPLVLLMIVLYFQFKLALIINHQPTLTANPPAYYALALPYPEWQYHLIGVGRQLALLVLPTLGPLVIWGVFNRQFLGTFVGARALEPTRENPTARSPD